MKWFLELADKHFLFRRFALLVLLYVTVDAFAWAKHFAEATDKSGAELGLIIAAVTGPVALLQRSILDLYNQARAAKEV